MLVPTPDCEADRITGTEDKKRKIGLVCEEDDKLEPSTRRPASKLRRKLSSCTETIELNPSSSNIPQYSNLKTTRPRKDVTIARFSDLDINCIQLKERQKAPPMKFSEPKQLGDNMKGKLMGRNSMIIKESEKENKNLHKYRVSWWKSYQFC